MALRQGSSAQSFHQIRFYTLDQLAIARVTKGGVFSVHKDHSTALWCLRLLVCTECMFLHHEDNMVYLLFATPEVPRYFLWMMKIFDREFERSFHFLIPLSVLNVMKSVKFPQDKTLEWSTDLVGSTLKIMSRQYSQFVRSEGCRQHMLLQDKGHAHHLQGLGAR